MKRVALGFVFLFLLRAPEATQAQLHLETTSGTVALLRAQGLAGFGPESDKIDVVEVVVQLEGRPEEAFRLQAS